uniref:PIN domain-containing protein n=1 Tax=Candidatus Kentrum sp. TC TaxID=2126339 RepID=A0A450Z1F4_9GAMM|nr:MAG: PIN domain-containing protein [Candidatus Kentron sp. TC]VFK63081.1 MAG: PIN domain-containing protein [Candidatus Kentron sp. TC]
MLKPRIYTDTSVIGGCLDEEFQTGSKALFDRFESGSAILVLSGLTLFELENAPPRVREVLNRVPAENIQRVELTAETEQLADKYLSEGVVPMKSRADARHIALATVNRADVLVSWNFKHIVNLERIRGYNAVNLKQGYPMIEIRTPLEILRYE